MERKQVQAINASTTLPPSIASPPFGSLRPPLAFFPFSHPLTPTRTSTLFQLDRQKKDDMVSRARAWHPYLHLSLPSSSLWPATDPLIRSFPFLSLSARPLSQHSVHPQSVAVVVHNTLTPSRSGHQVGRFKKGTSSSSSSWSSSFASVWIGPDWQGSCPILLVASALSPIQPFPRSLSLSALQPVVSGPVPRPGKPTPPWSRPVWHLQSTVSGRSLQRGRWVGMGLIDCIALHCIGGWSCWVSGKDPFLAMTGTWPLLTCFS